jgi:Reverse transcriptase (RNA-dependent DNA polymerase)
VYRSPSPSPAHGVEHNIETAGRPTTAKFRRLDPVRLAAAKAEFDKMLAAGVVRRSSSSWSSLLHMVQKKDGGWRPCGDFRRLNNVTVEDKYPLPNMADLSARLDGCVIFSKLDLQKGYFQVPVAATDVAKTAIITPFGLFEFLSMPFGLKNAGMTEYFLICNIPLCIWMTAWWPARACRTTAFTSGRLYSVSRTTASSSIGTSACLASPASSS